MGQIWGYGPLKEEHWCRVPGSLATTVLSVFPYQTGNVYCVHRQSGRLEYANFPSFSDRLGHVQVTSHVQSCAEVRAG